MVAVPLALPTVVATGHIAQQARALDALRASLAEAESTLVRAGARRAAASPAASAGSASALASLREAVAAADAAMVGSSSQDERVKRHFLGDHRPDWAPPLQRWHPALIGAGVAAEVEARVYARGWAAASASLRPRHRSPNEADAADRHARALAAEFALRPAEASARAGHGLEEAARAAAGSPSLHLPSRSEMELRLGSYPRRSPSSPPPDEGGPVGGRRFLATRHSRAASPPPCVASAASPPLPLPPRSRSAPRGALSPPRPPSPLRRLASGLAAAASSSARLSLSFSSPTKGERVVTLSLGGDASVAAGGGAHHSSPSRSASPDRSRVSAGVAATATKRWASPPRAPRLEASPPPPPPPRGVVIVAAEQPLAAAARAPKPSHEPPLASCAAPHTVPGDAAAGMLPAFSASAPASRVPPPLAPIDASLPRPFVRPFDAPSPPAPPPSPPRFIAPSPYPVPSLEGAKPWPPSDSPLAVFASHAHPVAAAAPTPAERGSGAPPPTPPLTCAGVRVRHPRRVVAAAPPSAPHVADDLLLPQHARHGGDVTAEKWAAAAFASRDTLSARSWSVAFPHVLLSPWEAACVIQAHVRGRHARRRVAEAHARGLLSRAAAAPSAAAKKAGAGDADTPRSLRATALRHVVLLSSSSSSSKGARFRAPPGGVARPLCGLARIAAEHGVEAALAAAAAEALHWSEAMDPTPLSRVHTAVSRPTPAGVVPSSGVPGVSRASAALQAARAAAAATTIQAAYRGMVGRRAAKLERARRMLRSSVAAARARASQPSSPPSAPSPPSVPPSPAFWATLQQQQQQGNNPAAAVLAFFASPTRKPQAVTVQPPPPAPAPPAPPPPTTTAPMSVLDATLLLAQTYADVRALDRAQQCFTAALESAERTAAAMRAGGGGGSGIEEKASAAASGLSKVLASKGDAAGADAMALRAAQLAARAAAAASVAAQQARVQLQPRSPDAFLSALVSSFGWHPPAVAAL